MTKTISKRLKPIDQDVHLKYRCPECSLDHWISLKEAKTPGFRIVCDCNEVLRVKLVEKNKICFKHTDKKKKTTISRSISDDTQESKELEIPIDLLSQACTILLGYGFDIKEAEDLLVSTYKKTPINTCVNLIKQALINFGENKNG